MGIWCLVSLLIDALKLSCEWTSKLGIKRTLPAIKKKKKEKNILYSGLFSCIYGSQMFLMEWNCVWFYHDLGSV